MPVISGRQSVGFGTTFLPFSGSQFEYIPFDGELEIGLKVDRTLVTATLFSGPDVLGEPGQMIPVGAANEPPKVPDDFHWIEKVAQGDRMKLLISEGNASGTSVLFFVARLTPRSFE
jgi:hypothetical protein